jgi:transcriptional regulator with XRE-family HTH domain
MDIGTRLRELREAKRYSQGDIEKRSGLLRCYLSRVECGYTEPKIETLEKWAKALDLELYQLFYQGKGKPIAPKVAEPARRNTRQGALLNLFQRMPERDKHLILVLARRLSKGGGSMISRDKRRGDKLHGGH